VFYNPKSGGSQSGVYADYYHIVFIALRATGKPWEQAKEDGLSAPQALFEEAMFGCLRGYVPLRAGLPDPKQ